ncbi:TPA: PglZ domain-containing protein, partial [Candidatus Bathyarchaeota archaeon]|nr:PglZ domain-containing protein [Candidatus Bathyarchaeota archaeon]
KELIIILKIPEKFRESLGINAKILSSTNTFYDWLNKKWQIYATSIINKGQPYLDFSNIKTEIAGLLSLGLLSPVETKSVDLVDVWFSNWIRRKVLEIDEIRRLREELSRKIDKLHDFVEWFSILRNISELELRIDDRDVEIINEFIGILDFIDEKFSNWYLSSIGEISNRSPYYKPWTVDQVLNHLRMRYGSKICLVVIDALSYFSWLQFRDFLVKNGYLIKREELILTWIPTITEICRKSLLSGKKVRDLIKMNSKTEDRLCLDFWRNYVEQDKIAYLKFESGKPWGVSEEELEHEIIAIVINQIDDIVHTSSSYQELNERLRQCFERIHPVINKISKLGFNVFITSDHGFRRCTEKEYYGKKTFINTKGSRFFISERKEQVGGVIVNGSIVGFKESEYIHLSCNSVTYSKFEKIFDHGGITVQECIIPFVEVSTLEEVG